MLYKPESNSFEEIEPLRGKQIYDIHEDLQGNIWLATYSDGIFRYRPSERRAKQYLHDNSDPGSLPYDMVLSVFEDSQQRIWLTTQGGGCCLYSPQSDSFTSYNTASGLPDNTIYQIVEDHEGLLWMSTNKGLACFDPTTSTVCATFSSDNGLLNNQFNYKSSHIAPDGKIYFGSTEGLIAFYPKQLHYSVPQPEIVVSSLSVLGQRVSPHSSDTPLSTIIDKTSSLTLRHNQNSFSLKLVSPNYISPQSNQIEYQLSGFDEQWIQGGINPRASYTNIPPGSYTFRARFQSKADSPQSSPERQIRIHITPPFYSSNVAIAIYLLLAAISITRAVYVIRRRNLARYRAKLAQVDKAKEKAIHDSKIETYTNAAHIKFLDKLNDVIDSNYDDPEFSIDTIAAKLNMSRATFYRKTSEVMEMSPNDYLRLIRLKKAAKLMQEGSSRISEICYQVGFSSPSYFTKCFSAQFGMSPKEYIESRSATKC